MVKPAVAALLAAAYIIVGLVALAEFPLVWGDEPWYAQSAWMFADQGRFTLPMFADLARFDQDNVVYGRTYLAALAGVFELGGLSPYTGRLPSFISGLVAITAVFGIGRELWSPKIGALAALFTALAPSFVVQSHDARPEIMLVAFWTAAFYLTLLGSRRESVGLLFLAGFVAALSADVHLNGLIVGPALFLVLFIQRPSARALVALIAGGVAGALWFGVLHVGTDWTILRDQVSAYSFGLPLDDLLSQPALVVALEVARYVLVEPRLTLVLLGLAVVATVVLVMRHRDRSLLALLVFAATVFVFMMLFSGTKVQFYGVLLLPVAAILVARFVDILPTPADYVTSGVVVMVSLVSVATVAIEAAPGDYDRYVARIREHIPPGSVVQADPEVWYGLSDYHQIALPYFLFVGPYEEEVRRLGIEYVVGDNATILPSCDRCLEFEPAMKAFLAENAELVAEIRDPYYGEADPGGGEDLVTPIYRLTEPES